MLNVIRNFNKYFKKMVCVCLFCAVQCCINANLLWQGAAVLLWHAFPHRLLDRLDLLAQWDARCSGWFDHFSVNRLLFFILLLQRGGGRRREDKQEKRREKRWFIVMGEFNWFYKLTGLTLASEPALTTWSERLDRSKPPKLHVLCGGAKTQSTESHSKGHMTQTPHPRPARDNSQWFMLGTTRAAISLMLMGLWFVYMGMMSYGTVDSQQTWCNTTVIWLPL